MLKCGCVSVSTTIINDLINKGKMSSLILSENCLNSYCDVSYEQITCKKPENYPVILLSVTSILLISHL